MDNLIWIIIVVLVVLALLGYFGRGRFRGLAIGGPRPNLEGARRRSLVGRSDPDQSSVQSRADFDRARPRNGGENTQWVRPM
jgi:hypothetical protein